MQKTNTDKMQKILPSICLTDTCGATFNQKQMEKQNFKMLTTLLSQIPCELLQQNQKVLPLDQFPLGLKEGICRI